MKNTMASKTSSTNSTADLRARANQLLEGLKKVLTPEQYQRVLNAEPGQASKVLAQIEAEEAQPR